MLHHSLLISCVLLLFYYLFQSTSGTPISPRYIYGAAAAALTSSSAFTPIRVRNTRQPIAYGSNRVLSMAPKNVDVPGELAYFGRKGRYGDTERKGTYFIRHYTQSSPPPIEDINVIDELGKAEEEFLYLQSSPEVLGLIQNLLKGRVPGPKRTDQVFAEKSEEALREYLMSHITLPPPQVFEQMHLDHFSSDRAREKGLGHAPIHHVRS
jgi:hypothetical protein